MAKKVRIARSAVTGRIVSKQFAKSHPRTTVIETRSRKRGGKKK